MSGIYSSKLFIRLIMILLLKNSLQYKKNVALAFKIDINNASNELSETHDCAQEDETNSMFYHSYKQLTWFLSDFLLKLIKIFCQKQLQQN